MRLAKVPNDKASVTIPEMVSRGIADKNAKICKGDGVRYVPIHDGRENDVIGMGIDVVDGETFKRETRSPQNRIKGSLAHLPKEVVNELPMRWEFVGDIVILRLEDSAVPYKDDIGKAYAEALNAKTVCADIGGVSGELRKPSMNTIFGTDTEAVRLENGILYKFDVTKVMFASGNTNERNRMKHIDCKDETIVDMFAGIGYFTLPMAKFSHCKKVIACEKNPDSFRYLKENVRLNEVGDIVEPVFSDNRELNCKDADRIIMGYVQKTSQFLEKAGSMIKHGGIIHYHDTFYVNEYEERLNKIFKDVFGSGGYDILSVKEVKSFAPSVSHYVADVRISHSF
ncbi:MAG: class I SAM-dependent methyltransferase family protein [Methanomassiliicoccaceae archaeon]|nr:class I SAM-dependent methyltransferase family protein [Methanomassiliicoccaceae archaeon]